MNFKPTWSWTRWWFGIGINFTQETHQFFGVSLFLGPAALFIDVEAWKYG